MGRGLGRQLPVRQTIRRPQRHPITACRCLFGDRVREGETHPNPEIGFKHKEEVVEYSSDQVEEPRHSITGSLDHYSLASLAFLAVLFRNPGPQAWLDTGRGQDYAIRVTGQPETMNALRGLIDRQTAVNEIEPAPEVIDCICEYFA